MPLEIRSPDELGPAFEAMVKDHVEALAVPPDTVFNNFRGRIAELAATMRMPAIYGFREHVEDGGLMSYGPDNRGNYRRAQPMLIKFSRARIPVICRLSSPPSSSWSSISKPRRRLALRCRTRSARADEVIE